MTNPAEPTKSLRVGILDLVTHGPTGSLWARAMHANLASIMPQVLGVWCRDDGHDVSFVCYTGLEDLTRELPREIDVLFVGAFTQSAQLAYAVCNLFRGRGAVTVLGGPHARCYPQDARKYADYVLGFTDREVVREVLEDCRPRRPIGAHLSADGQPRHLPGVEERWPFIEATLQKAPAPLRIVPMLGSLGCPYSCDFCIDSTVDYEPLSFEQLQSDLRFLLGKFERPRVAFHDPNFGIRFDDYLDAIEEAVPPGSIDFIAESSLSLLSEPHLQRLEKNGFKAMLPGIESWFSLGNKSKTRSIHGREKVDRISEHLRMVQRYIPYVQANFVLGLDCDHGPEPFELTKRFIDETPGVFPGFSLLTAFGRAAPLNLEYQREDRVLGFPFHALNNNHAMNVRPKNYEWPEFYDRVVDLTKHAFSPRAIARRFRAGRNAIPRVLNVLRAVSSEGRGRIRHHSEVRRRLEDDVDFRAFFEQETDEIPSFYRNRVREDLGPFWEHLPDGALRHDPRAYLAAENGNGSADPGTIELERPGGAEA
jgi:hypothetical protein